MATRKDNLIQIRCDDAFVQMIDDWRRQQPELPSRAEAIRRLVQEAMERTREKDRPTS
jgi:Arc/MetJ-type ribon-helix-helix transcriptional regulator